MAWKRLSDEQWDRIRVHLPERRPSPKGGRPRVPDRQCFEGLLWIGSQWSALPREYGSPSTVWRRFQEWEANGTLLGLWRALLGQLNDEHKLRWDECFADGSFAPAKKEGWRSARPSGERAPNGLVWVDGQGTPLGAYLDSASPSEVKLLEKDLATVAVGYAHRPGRPRQRLDRLVLDRGYDRHDLRQRLAKRGIEPIIPARANNHRATHQDGRKLRRYRHRWIVERTLAWLGHFRRLVVRYDLSIDIYAGFFHLTCAMLTLRTVLKWLLVKSIYLSALLLGRLCRSHALSSETYDVANPAGISRKQ